MLRRRSARLAAAASLLLRLARRHIRLVRRGEGPQCIPARVRGDLGRTVAIASVEVGAARWTEAFAIFLAEQKARRRQEPRFTNRGAQIYVVGAWIERVDV